MDPETTLVVVPNVLVVVDGICRDVELGLAPPSPRHPDRRSASTTRTGVGVDRDKGGIIKTNPDSSRPFARRVVRVSQSPKQPNMPRTPLYALTAAVFAIAAVAIVTSPEPRVAFAEVPPAPPVQAGPPSTASALPGAVEASALTELEASLTEQAAARSTSTTSTTTTTTTTVAAQPGTTAAPSPAPTETPPSDQPPASTTTTTQAPDPPPEGFFDSGAESDFASRIAGIRSANGKSGLTRDGSLDAYARSWAKQMGESGSLSHSNIGSLMPPWTVVAENIGQGGSVGEVFNLLAGSSGHLANMLGDFTHMGIGVWRDPGGTIWTTHVFALP